ncbi:MPP2 protein, partial [Polypterus senegalus]
MSLPLSEQVAGVTRGRRLTAEDQKGSGSREAWWWSIQRESPGRWIKPSLGTGMSARPKPGIGRSPVSCLSEKRTAAGSVSPVAWARMGEAAMQQGVDTLSDVPNSTVANDLDLIFLKEIMESPIAHEKLEETKLEAVRDNNLELVQDILVDISPLVGLNSMADELARILTEPHFQSLLETHDSVASKSYETPPPSPCAFMDPALNNQPVPPDAVRMVGIRKVSGEHLGVTFRVENNDLVIARILHGGMIDQQGLLHVGDIIKEVNGKEVGSDPKVLQEMLKDASGSVVLKILPSYQEPHPPRQVFVKCHFDYDPAHDNLIPCKEAGMTFNAGDILQIVNQEDLNWWQACHVKGGSAGLIPSQLLEEKRKAFVKRDLELAASASNTFSVLASLRISVSVYYQTDPGELREVSSRWMRKIFCGV